MIKDRKKFFGDFNLNRNGLNLKLKYIKNEFNYHYNIYKRIILIRYKLLYAKKIEFNIFLIKNIYIFLNF